MNAEQNVSDAVYRPRCGGQSAISSDWPALLALFFGMFLVLGSWNTFGVFLKYLAKDLAASRGLISGIMSLTWIAYGVAAVPAGLILDRRGPKTVMTAAAFVVGIAYVLSALASSPWQLYLYLGLLLGSAFPVFWVIPAALVSKWFQRKRGLALGLMLSAGGIGQMLVPPLVSFLVDRYGWRPTYIILGVLIWAGCVPLVLFLRRRSGANLVFDNVRASLSGSDEANALRRASLTKWSAAEAVKTRAFWLLFGIWFLLPISAETVIVHVVPYATDTGVEAVAAAFILSALGLTNAASRIMVGSVSDHLGSRQTYAVCLLLVALAVFALVAARGLWASSALAAIFGFGLGGSIPVYVKVVAEFFGPMSSGTVLGLLSCAWASGSALAVWLAGHIFDVTGSYFVAFVIGGALALLALTLVPFLAAPRKAGRAAFAS